MLFRQRHVQILYFCVVAFTQNNFFCELFCYFGGGGGGGFWRFHLLLVLEQESLGTEKFWCLHILVLPSYFLWCDKCLQKLASRCRSGSLSGNHTSRFLVRKLPDLPYISLPAPQQHCISLQPLPQKVHHLATGLNSLWIYIPWNFFFPDQQGSLKLLCCQKNVFLVLLSPFSL